ncbi:hypothetical protein PENSPDRAFT_348869 [Peniophora sp. CONT]|nr:hypothetical protein PENSPDRAFT_348869 [Peniophora sp. CONT]
MQHTFPPRYVHSLSQHLAAHPSSETDDAVRSWFGRSARSGDCQGPAHIVGRRAQRRSFRGALSTSPSSTCSPRELAVSRVLLGLDRVLYTFDYMSYRKRFMLQKLEPLHPRVAGHTATSAAVFLVVASLFSDRMLGMAIELTVCAFGGQIDCLKGDRGAHKGHTEEKVRGFLRRVRAFTEHFIEKLLTSNLCSLSVVV